MNKSSLLLFLLLSTGYLQADLEDYFKPAIGKTDAHKMRNIDFIYTINLDQRPEKFASCIEQLAPYGITPYRFSAVNGWELTLEDINDLGVKYEKSWMQSGHLGTYYESDDFNAVHEIVQNEGRTYFCHCMPRGSIGIVLSHLSILEDAYVSGYETIWVMEDDIQIIRDPHIISDLIEDLDELMGKDNWDILFTDQDTKGNDGNYVPCSSFAWRPNFHPSNPYRFAERQDISSDFRRVGARYGAYSMIVRRSGMRKILRFLKTHHVFLPFDMEFTLPNDIHLISVRNDVVSTQPKALSDNGAPNYQNRQ